MKVFFFCFVTPALVHSFQLFKTIPKVPWPDYVDKWARDNSAPKALVDAFKAAPDYSVSLEPYKRPNQYVKTILSVGDSYTAGLGSDGQVDYYADSGSMWPDGCSRYAMAWPERLRDHQGWDDLQGAGWRKNNFGACSGAKVDQIIEKQLEIGENRDEDKYKKIGEGDLAPQIAVLTAGGNDARFGDVIINCVLDMWDSEACPGILDEIEDDLKTRDMWKDKYHRLWSAIITKGRMAKGANPPESFQIFHGTYVPFFNQDDPVCDGTSWNQLGNRYMLTREFRKRLNDLVETINSIIREAADEYKSWGVFYVDKYQRAFDGHRFCDPTGYDHEYDRRYHTGMWEDCGSQTWFWSYTSTWKDHYEGPDHPIWTDYEGMESVDGVNKTQVMFDALIPNKTEQELVSKGSPPSDFSPAFRDDESLFAALQSLGPAKEDNVTTQLFDNYFRTFHVKGRGLEAWRDGFFETIKMHRDWDFPHGEKQPPETTPPNKNEPSYTPGSCSFHLEHIEHCIDEPFGYTHKGLFGLIDVKDASGKTLDLKDSQGNDIKPTTLFKLWELSTPEDPEADDVVKLKSVLPVELHISPFNGWELNFTYGATGPFNAGLRVGATDLPSCRVSEWTPQYRWASKVECAERGIKAGEELKRHQIDCTFHCD